MWPTGVHGEVVGLLRSNGVGRMVRVEVRMMRHRCAAVFAVAVLVVAACDGGDGNSSVTETIGSAVPDGSAPTSSGVPPTSVVDTEPLPTVRPSSVLRFGAAGLVRVTDTGEVSLINRPVQWAASDGAGGVLFTDWNPDRFGPTWWLAAGAGDPVVASEWDGPLLAARLNGQPAAVGPLPTDECESDGGVDMVARILDTGETVALQCWVGGPDSGREPDSFGGGMFVGVEWYAVHVSGRYTDTRLVFRDASGETIEHPWNPFNDDCSPCELTAALSPDGSRLAVIHRPDAGLSNSDFYEDWLVDTASVAADIRVIDLTDGETLYADTVRPGATPAAQTWFDGRYVVFGPDRFTHPTLMLGDSGDSVRELQARLIDAGADIEIDGTFGPSTEAAVEAFHTDRFGSPRSWVGPDTWSELGVPNTIVDTQTGQSIELAGTITLETTLTDASPPEPTDARVGQLTMLRADGLGLVDFGTPGDQTIAALTDILGPFDRNETVDPDSVDCVEGSGWRECLDVVENARILTWTKWGLNVLVTDHGGWDGAVPRSVALHFGSWQAVVPSTGNTLESADGLHPGMTVGQLRAIHPDVEFGYGEGIISGVSIKTSDGDYWGELDWDPVSPANTWSELIRAVQEALNASGADLVVDGEWGPRSQQAWEVFFEQNNLGPAPPTMWLTPEVSDALRLPPDDFVVAALAASCIEAGADDVC